MATIIIPSAIPTLNIGGRIFTDLTNLIVLVGNGVGPTNLNSTLRKQNGSAGYQVPATKTFQALALRIMTSVTAANSGASILYSDNDVGTRSPTVFTNPVYIGGSSTNGTVGDGPFVAGQFTDTPLQFSIPTGKYVGTITAGAGVYFYQVYGYEV